MRATCRRGCRRLGYAAGSQALKRASYHAIVGQHELDFAGVKLFYRLDAASFSLEEGLRPMPSVVIYQ